MRIDLRSFEEMKPLIRSRLLSSEWHKIDDLAKRNIAGDVWLIFYVKINDEATWSITYSEQQSTQILLT